MALAQQEEQLEQFKPPPENSTLGPGGSYPVPGADTVTDMTVPFLLILAVA
jgi:hypothetical protein